MTDQTTAPADATEPDPIHCTMNDGTELRYRTAGSLGIAGGQGSASHDEATAGTPDPRRAILDRSLEAAANGKWVFRGKLLADLDRTAGSEDLAAEVRKLRAERAATLHVLAPDVDTEGRPLDQVAEAALAFARRGATL